MNRPVESFQQMSLDLGFEVPLGVSVPQKIESETKNEKTLPLLIGGVKSHNDDKDHNVIGVDWLQGTIPHDRLFNTDDRRGLVSYLDEICGGEAKLKDYGRYRYNACVEWKSCGVIVYFDQDASKAETKHGGRACVALTGTFLQMLSDKDLFLLIGQLKNEFWFSATRVDICWDDYEKIIRPYELKPIVERKDFVGYKSIEHKEPKTWKGGELVRKGDSMVFGLRGHNGGGRYLRVYDKNLESDGEKDCIRWEIEFSKEKAKKVFLELAMSGDVESFGVLCGALVGGCIDFIDRGAKSATERNLSRYERLEWWARIVEMLGSVKIRNATRDDSLQKSRDWASTAVGGTLAMLHKVDPTEFWEWIEAVVCDSELTDRHRKMIIDYERFIGLKSSVEVPF